MSFAMYLGFVVGFVIGIVAAGVGLSRARKQRGVFEQDERTELISARAGRTALVGVSIIAFVAWVAENAARHLDGLDVHFFSPWAIMLFAGFVLYLASSWYESRKVSDPDADLDENEKKRLRAALGGMGASICFLTALLSTVSTQIDRSVFWFLIGIELLLVVAIGLLLGQGRRRRTRA